MLCPYCQTDNRDDRETCYHCNKDISMLRLIVNKAKHHYNQALEHAERNRTDEAIVELKNALELDSTMANAHVVLGTLYAQKEQFAEAQDAWHQALKIDHRLEKAHEYLIKSEEAKVVFPAIKRLKKLSVVLIIALAALLIGIGLILVGKLRPSGNTLVAELHGKKLESAQAHDELDEFSRRANASPASRKFADEIKRQIEARWQEQLNFASKAISADNPALALQIVENLAEKAPDDSTMNSVRRTRERATKIIMDHLQIAAAGFRKGGITYEEVQNEVQKALSVLPQGAERNQVEALNKKINTEYRDRTMAEADRVLSDAPLTKALERYSQWKAQFPDLIPRLEPLLTQRLGRETDEAVNRAQDLISKDDLEGAQRVIDDLQRMYLTSSRPAPTERLDLLRAELAKAEETQRLAKVHSAFGEKRWEDFLKATSNTADLTTDTVELAKLKTQREQAWRGFAEENFEWMEQRDDKFSMSTMNADEAARVLRIYSDMLEHLPKSLNYAKGPILFYATSAALRLGQKDKARELLERVKQEFPKSYIQKSVKEFEKRFAEQLK